MKLRLAALASVVVIGGLLVPSAYAGGPAPTRPGAQVVKKAKLAAVVRPTARSIDLLAR